MRANYKVAYISRLIYPDPAANALQTIQMAAAFARQTGNTHLFVHDLASSEDQIREQYAINGPLQLWSLRAKSWPSYIYEDGQARVLAYNSMIGTILGIHPIWRRARKQQGVIFVRSRLEFLYWGLFRPYLRWLRNWIFVYEAHDLEGGKPEDDKKRTARKLARTRRALENYDLVIAITSALAEDIQSFTDGVVKPVVLSLATGIPRLQYSPQPTLNGQAKETVLGYIGTVDQMRGVDHLLQALRFLPDQVRLRMVGRIPGSDDAGNYPSWLSELLADPAIANKVEIHPPVPYAEVARQIDRCDIVLQPAGLNTHASRYAAPLKLFDYMARGKPIVAAGVPCHVELLKDGLNARIYPPGDSHDLANCVMSLIENPQQAETVARAAWEQSIQYTYEVRAQQILNLLDEL